MVYKFFIIVKSEFVVTWETEHTSYPPADTWQGRDKMGDIAPQKFMHGWPRRNARFGGFIPRFCAIVVRSRFWRRIDN